MNLFRCSLVLFLVGSVLLFGCSKPKEQEQAKKEKSGIIGKTTDQIGEFDPNSGAKVSDGRMEPTSPLNPFAAAKAYKPIVEKLMKMKVYQALEMYRATSGRYPKDYEEFMEKVARPNRLEFPVLPGGWIYQYDVKNHTLVVVEGEKKEDE